MNILQWPDILALEWEFYESNPLIRTFELQRNDNLQNFMSGSNAQKSYVDEPT